MEIQFPPRQQSCYRICLLAETMVGTQNQIYVFTWISWRTRDSICTGLRCGRASSPPKFEVCSTKMCHQPPWPFFHPKHLFTSTVAGSQAFLHAKSFLSPPASPALGQVSECQQSLPNVGTGECFWSGPLLLVFCPPQYLPNFSW